MVRKCDAQHCSGADKEINQICKDLEWPVNHPVLTRDSKGPCVCSCSCLAHGTPVQAGDSTYRSIETYSVGDTVLASGKDLKWMQQRVEFSSGTTGASVQKYTVIVLYANTGLIVTSDHVFLLHDRSLKRADKLIIGDKLMTPDGKPMPVDAVHIGDFTAGFHHIATKKKKPPANLDGHLLNTNGVVSGDYSVQLFAPDSDPAVSFKKGHEHLPIVGSPEYVALYGAKCLEAPDLSSGFAKSKTAGIAKFRAGDFSAPTFIPASETILSIPEDADSFLSDADARARAAAPKRAWNDPLSREWSEYLIDHHQHFYANVQYHLDWANNDVNAYAWVQNGTRHVALLGGLVRDLALELEGIALVLAHELAHHYGGAPTGTSGLSCEGQSDYHGVRNVMRKVWFGEQYISLSDKAIDQMADFFGVPNNPTPPGGSSGCSHPPGACRIATYHAAVTLSGKPGCAG